MAFPINVAPIDTTDPGSFYGPFSHSGALYILSNMFTGFINAYKSVDNGDTWTPLQFNLGPFGGSSFELGLLDVVFDADNIICVYETTFTTIGLRRFSMATETWGAEENSTIDASSGEDTNGTKLRAVRLPSGDIFIFFTEWLTTFQTINYTVYRSGVWDPNTILVNAAGTVFNFLSAAFQDSNGLLHVFYQKAATDTPNADLHHITLSTGGVAGAENQIDATLADFPTGRAFEFNSKPYLIYYNAGARTGVWEGSDLSAIPIWAFTLLNTIAFAPAVVDIGPQQAEAGSPDYGAKGFGFENSGIAYVIWQSSNGDANSYTVDQIYMSTNSGSGWSAPVLLFDNAVDPGGFGPDKLFGITAAVYGSTLYVFADINCGGLDLVARAESVLAIDCDSPPDGTIGIPYSHFLLASGGTPPYGFALTAGALPDGLLLNAGTGEISGTPTLLGIFPFTVEVTDAADNTATVECSITITSLLIICDDPPVGIVGTFYTHDFPVEGGTPPYTFEITPDTLPPGLTLDANTGELSGIPTTAGVFPFTVTVTDSDDNVAEVECSITIRKRCLLESTE